MPRIKTMFDEIPGCNGVPLGRLQEVIATLKAPERTAYKVGGGIGDGAVFQSWSNRPAMARSIRMQEAGASFGSGWKSVVPLGPTEGY